MKKQFRTNSLLGILVLLTLVAASLYSTLFVFVGKSGDALEKMGEELALETARDERLGLLAGSIKETEEERQALAQYFVDEDAVVSTIQQIEDLAGRAGVELTMGVDVEAAPSVPGEATQEQVVVFSLETHGPWGNVFHFLTLIDALPYRTVIDQAFLEKTGPELWRSVMSLAIVMEQQL